MWIYEVAVNYTTPFGSEERDAKYFFVKGDAEDYIKIAEKDYFHNSPRVYLNYVKVWGDCDELLYLPSVCGNRTT